MIENHNECVGPNRIYCYTPLHLLSIKRAEFYFEAEMGNSVDPDQLAFKLIWIYTVYKKIQMYFRLQNSNG